MELTRQKNELGLIFSGFEKPQTAIPSILLNLTDYITFPFSIPIKIVKFGIGILVYERGLKKQKVSDIEKVLISGNLLAVLAHYGLSKLVNYLWKKL
jgi:hypothetical protein